MISDTDISIVKNMMRLKPVKYISAVIDQPEDIVSDLIKNLCQSDGLVAFVGKVRVRNLKSNNKRKPSAAREKKLKKLKDEIIEQKQKNKAERIRVERQRELQKRIPEQVFKSINFNYREKVMVRVDSKTYIYAEPGKEKEAKENYLRFHKI